MPDRIKATAPMTIPMIAPSPPSPSEDDPPGGMLEKHLAFESELVMVQPLPHEPVMGQVGVAAVCVVVRSFPSSVRVAVDGAAISLAVVAWWSAQNLGM